MDNLACKKNTERYIMAMNKAERTKKFVIEQVAPVFNRKGYAATSLKDLTETTGLSKGAIYGNFKNKDEVALLAFEHNVGFIRDRLRGNMLGMQTFREKLLAYPTTFREIYRQVLQSGGCPILNTAVDSGDVNALLQEAVRKTIAEWKRSIVSLVEGGVDNGELSPDSHAENTAQVLICLVEGGYAMTKATGEEGYLQNSLSQVESIILAL
jgi:TetR/AcrR family transcriptional regulator, transcriptional repressor for nem operon